MKLMDLQMTRTIKIYYWEESKSNWIEVGVKTQKRDYLGLIYSFYLSSKISI